MRVEVDLFQIVIRKKDPERVMISKNFRIQLSYFACYACRLKSKFRHHKNNLAVDATSRHVILGLRGFL